MKFRVWAATNKIGSKSETVVDIDPEDIEGLEGVERDKVLEELLADTAYGLYEWGWEEVE